MLEKGQFKIPDFILKAFDTSKSKSKSKPLLPQLIDSDDDDDDDTLEKKVGGASAAINNTSKQKYEANSFTDAVTSRHDVWRQTMEDFATDKTTPTIHEGNHFFYILDHDHMNRLVNDSIIQVDGDSLFMNLYLDQNKNDYLKDVIPQLIQNGHLKNTKYHKEDEHDFYSFDKEFLSVSGSFPNVNIYPSRLALFCQNNPGNIHCFYDQFTNSCFVVEAVKVDEKTTISIYYPHLASTYNLLENTLKRLGERKDGNIVIEYKSLPLYQQHVFDDEDIVFACILLILCLQSQTDVSKCSTQNVERLKEFMMYSTKNSVEVFKFYSIE